MLPVNAVKDAVKKLSDDGKTKQEFISIIEQICDEYPDQIDELLNYTKVEITKTNLKKSTYTEILTLLEQSKRLHPDKLAKDNFSPHIVQNKFDFLKKYFTSSQLPETQLKTGVIIRNTYQLEQQLGSGGMGELWKATHLIQDAAEVSDSDRFVAIKFLNKDFRKHPDALKALAREFAYSRKLIHPNIVQVFELNYSGNQIYIAMEYLIGQPLDKWIKDHSKGISLENASPIILGICKALEFAHAQDFIHLDIKPSNVIYDPETKMVKVIDFGIARHANPLNRENTGFDLGKLNAVTGAYASLEMLRYQDPHPKDDIYGLACIVYELLTGHHPYEKKPADTVLSAGYKPSPVPALKSSQNKLLLKGLEILRKKRISNVEEFRHGLLSKDFSPSLFRALSTRVVITSIVLGCAFLLAPIVIKNIKDIRVDPIQQAILDGKESGLKELYSSQNQDQFEILEDKRIIKAIFEIYKKSSYNDPIKEIKASQKAPQKRIFENTNFKNELMLYYQQSTDKYVDQDEYPKAMQLLASIRGVYPDSNQIAEKSKMVRIAKNQRLTQLANQLESCFNDRSKAVDKISDCLLSNHRNILKIEPDKKIPLDEINQWFKQSILNLLNQNKMDHGSELLGKWESLKKYDLIWTSVLHDAIAIGNANNKDLPQLWVGLLETKPERQSKILDIQPVREKLVTYVITTAARRTEQNHYTSAFELISDAVTAMKGYPQAQAALTTAQAELEQEQRIKIDKLNMDYLAKVKSCDPDQLKFAESIKNLGGNLKDSKFINQHCIHAIKNAIVNNDLDKVTTYFENWTKLNKEQPPEFNALELAKQIYFDSTELPANILTLAGLPENQQKLILDIQPVQERIITYMQDLVEGLVTESGFPSALQYIDDMKGKLSSHSTTISTLQQLHTKIQKQQTREIVSLLFDYQREVRQCSNNLGSIQKQLDKLGADRERFLDVDENCFRRMQEFLAAEDPRNAENVLEIWQQLRPDNELNEPLKRKLISEKLFEMKAQFNEILKLGSELKQNIENNNEHQIDHIINLQVNQLSPENAKKFWTDNEQNLTGYFISRAKKYIEKEQFDRAQKFCNQGLSFYPKSKTLKTECSHYVLELQKQRIEKPVKEYSNYLKKERLIKGVRYREGILGILDEISEFDKNNAILKNADVHLAFQAALLKSVEKMQIKEARQLNIGWAKFFDPERSYFSEEAIKIRASAMDQAATQALSISRELIQENLKSQANQFLKFGLELQPAESIKQQLQSELVNLENLK